MFAICCIHQAKRLTRPSHWHQNNFHSALAPQVLVPEPDLAGVPVTRYAVPALQPTPQRVRTSIPGRLLRVHNETVWRPGMTKAITSWQAAPAPFREALALRKGAAQPPLDLSLGHFGTTGTGKRSFVEEEEVFRLSVDTVARTAVLHVNADAFENRAARRRAQRAFLKEAGQLIAGMNLRVSEGVR